MFKNKGHHAADGDIKGLEKQIATMLEKVLSDDDNERMTTISDGNLNTTFDSLEANESPIKQGNNHQKRPSLFYKRPDAFQRESQDVFMGRNNNRRPNTINYGKSEKIFPGNYNPLLKNGGDIYNNLIANEGVNFIPSDIFSLQLRLKMSSEQNPSK
jgi:hypothetical protein